MDLTKKILETIEEHEHVNYESEDSHYIPNDDWEDLAKDLNDLFALHVVSGSAEIEDKQTPLNWLLTDKFKIVKGSTYRLPDITVRQCASWIGEYVKKHYR